MPATGCIHELAADGEPCDDGFACTSGDECSEGRCSGVPPQECGGDPSCALPSCRDTAIFEAGGAAFQDISETGEDLGLDGDDAVAGPIPIGFGFRAPDGGLRSQLWVSTNGLATFGGPELSFENTCIPDPTRPNDLLAVYWDDLECSLHAGCRISTRLLGDAPARTRIVQWTRARRLKAPESSLTMQAALHEDGTVELRYDTMTGADGGSATVGFEAANGSEGVQHSCDEPSITSGLSLITRTTGFECQCVTP